ncbi:MAG: phosphate signaling complex protein PhoU [Gammaproteobacteria bacterium]|nr:phosphate signaling complex protein PhoU [Gammaproteobacteria bacterium]
MSSSSIPQHISRQFDNDLENIRTRVLGMGGLVEQQLATALRALTEANPELGEKVISNEVKVNTLEVTIDEECTRILARRQPAAGDLRLVMAVAKTITDLERIGDESEKIAKMAIDLAGKQGPRSYYIGINAMGNHVRRMVNGALDAFARMDSKAALEVAKGEPESDDQYIALLRQLITYMMEDPRSIGSSLDAIWVARAMERIGDHARNICENVIYFVEGKDVRHISIEEMEREVNPPS